MIWLSDCEFVSIIRISQTKNEVKVWCKVKIGEMDVGSAKACLRIWLSDCRIVSIIRISQR